MAYFESILNLIDEGWEPAKGDGFYYGDYYGLIDWRVLKVMDGKILAISNQIIEWKQFDIPGNNDWETSTLREWLNNEFAITAFLTDPDEESIEDTLLMRNDLGDLISLLTYDEAEQHYDLLCELAGPSAFIELTYVDQFGDWYEGNNLPFWILPKDGEFTFVDVCNDAEISTDIDLQEDYWKSKNNFSNPLGVRPVIWLKTDDVY